MFHLALRNKLVRFANKKLARAVDSNWLTNGETACVVERLGRAGGEAVLIDIGANLGKWTGAVLERCPHVRAHCFEPLPELFEQIAASDRLTKHPVGLGDADRRATAYQTGLGGSLVPEKQTAAKGKVNKQVEVDIRHADAYLAGLNLDRIDYLKIDVDGTELDVLRGLTDTLAAHRPPVQFEFGYFNYQHGHSFHAVLKYFTQRDYTLHHITPKGLVAVGKYQRYASENPVNLNYLALPEG